MSDCCLPTHLEYLRKQAIAHAEPLDVQKYLSSNPWLDLFLKTGNHMIFAFSFTEKRYLFMTPNVAAVMGHPAEAFAEGGFAFTSHVFNQEDFRVYNEHIFRTNLQTLKAIPPAEHRNCQIMFTFRVKDQYGKWLYLQQQSAYIQSDSFGNPLVSFGIVTDISPYKTDNRIVYQINQLGNSQVRNLTTQHYFPNPEEGRLSRREREVLKWMVEGYSSKQIAAKMNLSEHTINTHRCNMLQKTNARNTADLIRYGALNHLL